LIAVAWTAIGLLALTALVAAWANLYLRRKLDAYTEQVKQAIERNLNNVSKPLHQ
jgi:biopolymer transport protein ExbB/TolQ